MLPVFPFVFWLVYRIWIDCQFEYFASIKTSFTNGDADRLYCFGYCDGDNVAACRKYIACFPFRRELYANDYIGKSKEAVEVRYEQVIDEYQITRLRIDLDYRNG